MVIFLAFLFHSYEVFPNLAVPASLGNASIVPVTPYDLPLDNLFLSINMPVYFLALLMSPTNACGPRRA